MTRYLEVTIPCDRAVLEPVMDLVGAVAGGGAAVEDPRDILAGRREGRWDYDDFALPPDLDQVTVRGYLPAAGDLPQRRQRLDAGLARLRSLGLGRVGSVQARWVEDADWAHAWKQYFVPLAFGRRLAVLPPWQGDDYDPGGRAVIWLDPGMAFGTGQHATTALCLEWLEELVTPGCRVLDIGTGSGILAIAAARLEAGAVLGVDTDPVAVAVATENTARNGVSASVAIAAGTAESPAVADWAAVQGHPDLVVSNIIADVIIDLAPGVAGLMPRGGRWLAAGIIAARAAAVRDALQAAGLEVQGERSDRDWVAVLSRHRS